MSYVSRYDKGDWSALCDVCGRKFHASKLALRWDGLRCCEQDWEIRQPQDFVRGVDDNQIVPWSRPEPGNSFIPVTTSVFFNPWYVSTSNATIGIVVIPHP